MLMQKLTLYAVYSLILLGLLMCLGCTPAPLIKTVKEVEFKTIDLPAVLLKPCAVTEPPDKADYSTADFTEREEHLTNYIIALLADLKVCNNQIGQLKLIRDEQHKAYTGVTQ